MKISTMMASIKCYDIKIVNSNLGK